MKRFLLGTVRGKTIEFANDPGLPDGESVRVIVESADRSPWGEGILKSAGGWSDEAGVDAIMDEIQASRKLDRRPQEADE